MTPQPIIFLHLPKTGGTSIRQVMRRVFINVSGPPQRWPDGRWTDTAPSHYNAAAWQSHRGFGLHERLLPKEVPYFTVLRDPIEREVSRYCHVSMAERREQGETLVGTYRPDWSMLHIFCGLPENKISELGAEHIDLALQNIREHVLYVGHTQRMNELGLWFRDEQGWPIELPLPHTNKADPTVTTTAEERAALYDHPLVRLDLTLYKELRSRGPYPQKW